MEQLVLSLIGPMDRMRAGVLRGTLTASFARAWFRDRAVRNFLLFLLATMIFLPVALYFPLWMLAFGPIVWGVPHVISSLRQQHHAFDRQSQARTTARKTMTYLGFLWIALCAVRILSDVYGHSLIWDVMHPGLLEGFFSLLTVGVLAWTLSFNWIWTLIAAIAIAAVNLMIWNFPYVTIGALVIAHNFIAFFFWILASPAGRERRFAATATILFALVHIAVWMKLLDGFINLMPSASSLAWSGLDIDGLGRLITPWSADASLWYRSVVLYAFGQSLHYFVWMKAIPDLHTPTNVPTNFRVSWSLLKKDLGGKVALVTLAVCLAPITVAILSGFSGALQLYFAVAAYHGYMELAGLSALTVKHLPYVNRMA